MTFKPLLAEKVNLETLKFPVMVSPKYDGYRCLIMPGLGPVSRNLKPVANNYTRGKLSELKLDYMDGELLTYTGDRLDPFNVIQSKLSSRSGMPDFRFMVFDRFEKPTLDFSTRLDQVYASPQLFNATAVRAVPVPHVMVHNLEELMAQEAKALKDGWEGLMIRDPNGVYKHGRSTVNEGILLKMKRFFDDEAVVVAAHELMHNANEAMTNALGYTERSSHKANMVGRNMLGKLTVKWKDVTFDIGTGFTEEQRIKYWGWGAGLVGLVATFKYQELGPNGKPRFPVFLGFRSDLI